MGHPVTSGGTFGLLSGENPRGPTETTPTHENLVNHLKQMGLKHEVVQGHYGSPETSVLVHNPTRDQMVSLGKRFGQESVIHSSGGKHELIYTHGPDAGKVHAASTHEFFKQPPEDFYTELPGHGHFRINFDFSKPPQLPVISKGMGADVFDKLYTVEEAQAELQKATREKVEALAKTLTELQVRELAKSKKLDKNLVPPHKHTVGSSVSGTEDVAMGKLNPPGKNDPIKAEKTELEDSAHGDEESSGEKSVADIRADAKERMSLCKCGGELYKNEMCKGCFEKSAMAKEEEPAEGHKVKLDGGNVFRPAKFNAPKIAGKEEPAEGHKVKLDKGQLIEAKDATPHPVPAEGGKVIPSPGSGSAPKANKSLKMLRDSAKAKAKMAKSEDEAPKWREISDRLHSTKINYKDYSIQEMATKRGEPKEFKLSHSYGAHHISTHPSLDEAKAAAHAHAAKTEKAEPPMAKPPSGVNMATHVPASKPKAPVVKEALPDVKPGKPAQMKHPYVAGLGVQKGDFGMGESGKAATLPAPSAATPESPKPKYTGADLNAAKAKLGKPGIFGRIGKKPNNQ